MRWPWLRRSIRIFLSSRRLESFQLVPEALSVREEVGVMLPDDHRAVAHQLCQSIHVHPGLKQFRRERVPIAVRGQGSPLELPLELHEPIGDIESFEWLTVLFSEKLSRRIFFHQLAHVLKRLAREEDGAVFRASMSCGQIDRSCASAPCGTRTLPSRAGSPSLGRRSILRGGRRCP